VAAEGYYVGRAACCGVLDSTHQGQFDFGSDVSVQRMWAQIKVELSVIHCSMIDGTG